MGVETESEIATERCCKGLIQENETVSQAVTKTERKAGIESCCKELRDCLTSRSYNVIIAKCGEYGLLA